MKKSTAILAIALAAASSSALAQAPAPPAPRPAAPGPALDLALEAAQAAIASCAASGYKVAVTVIDSADVVRVALTSDGVGPGPVTYSVRKANTALKYGESSLVMQEKVKADAALAATITADTTLLARGGALPLKSGGTVIGAIGVGGAPGGEKDDVCVTAAVKKIEARLAAARGPMVHAGGAAKVTDHVFVISDDNVPAVPNVGIIVGKKGMLVVDTGLGRRNGAIVLEEAHRVGGDQLPLYLVTTHIHPEHDLGAQAFPASTKMIRARTQVDEIAEVGLQTADAFSKRSDKMRELLEGAEFRKADVVFGKEHDLNLGGVRVKLISMGPNHTPGDTAIWVVEDKVLFTGDIAMKGLPAFASPQSSLNHWLQSLDRLEALKPSVVVPSHGPLGDTGFIENYRAYLTAVRDHTAGLKSQGKSLEETTPLVAAELKDKYSDGRMAGAIRAAYAEAK